MLHGFTSHLFSTTARTAVAVWRAAWCRTISRAVDSFIDWRWAHDEANKFYRYRAGPFARNEVMAGLNNTRSQQAWQACKLSLSLLRYVRR